MDSTGSFAYDSAVGGASVLCRGDLTGVVCITPYYMSTPQCLELAYPAERSRERQTDRQTEALYSSNKVHLKLRKMVHKKTPALSCPNLKTPS